jgi:16S rRNA A1518/A1519 N6-dimethyltransferase RsmA/KsgA/DIM1 with predicted DNA glycosylase/AP lyase activity
MDPISKNSRIVSPSSDKPCWRPGGDIPEIGAGIGATFSYYKPEARVTAIEPDDDLRAGAEEAAKVL